MSDLLPVLQARITSCTSCWLHSAHSGPVPYRGSLPAPILVIGEAPGKTEDTTGEPFAGKAGKYLTSALKQANIPLNRVGFCNVVSCASLKDDGRPRKPTSAEQGACRSNLRLQIAAARPQVTILAGAVALNAFRPDLKVSKERGRPIYLPHGVAVPTFHPAACLRAHHLKARLAKDLRQVRWRWKHGPLGRWPEDCRLCGREVEVYDRDGLAYCGRHEGWADDPPEQVWQTAMAQGELHAQP